MQSLRTNRRWWAFHDAVVRAVHTHSSRLFARRSLTSPRIRGASAEPSWTKNAPMQVPDSSRRIPPVRAHFAQARVVIADRSRLRDVSLWVAPLPTIPKRAQLEVRAPGRDHCARPGHTSRASAMLSGIISHRRPGHGTHRYRGHESVTDTLHCRDTYRRSVRHVTIDTPSGRNARAARLGTQVPQFRRAVRQSLAAIDRAPVRSGVRFESLPLCTARKSVWCFGLRTNGV